MPLETYHPIPEGFGIAVTLNLLRSFLRNLVWDFRNPLVETFDARTGFQDSAFQIIIIS
jgi:hypothetical protein